MIQGQKVIVKTSRPFKGTVETPPKLDPKSCVIKGDKDGRLYICPVSIIEKL